MIAFQPEEVFQAFARPELLRRWWGPNGFTNTFELFEFKAGGRWKFVMHGPNGANFKNESVFVEVDPSRIVIKHAVPPYYLLTVSIEPQEVGTSIIWTQVFESATVAATVRRIVELANEENLDRLESVLAGTP